MTLAGSCFEFLFTSWCCMGGGSQWWRSVTRSALEGCSLDSGSGTLFLLVCCDVRSLWHRQASSSTDSPPPFLQWCMPTSALPSCSRPASRLSCSISKPFLPVVVLVGCFVIVMRQVVNKTVSLFRRLTFAEGGGQLFFVV